MFVELMPLLSGRTVLITVAKVDGGRLPIDTFFAEVTPYYQMINRTPVVGHRRIPACLKLLYQGRYQQGHQLTITDYAARLLDSPTRKQSPAVT